MEKGVKIDIFKELNKFNEVVFTERGHTYTVGGQKATSVTTFIGQFKETFERDFWAARSAQKENVKLQDILDKWDSISLRACNKGSKFHAFAENYINNKILTNTIYDFDLDKKAYDKIESYFIAILGYAVWLTSSTIQLLLKGLLYLTGRQTKK